MIHKTAYFKIITDFIDRNSVKWSVAGGYPRDLANGLTPRDCDIVAYGFGSSAAIYEFQQRLSNFVLGLGVYSTESCGSEYVNNRIEGVVKTTEDIDIILWNPEHQTVQDVIDNFDFNINQYIMVQTFSGVYIARFKGMVFGVLHQLRNSDVTPERKSKMIYHALLMDWKVPQELLRPEPDGVELDFF